MLSFTRRRPVRHAAGHADRHRRNDVRHGQRFRQVPAASREPQAARLSICATAATTCVDHQAPIRANAMPRSMRQARLGLSPRQGDARAAERRERDEPEPLEAGSRADQDGEPTQPRSTRADPFRNGRTSRRTTFDPGQGAAHRRRARHRAGAAIRRPRRRRSLSGAAGRRREDHASHRRHAAARRSATRSRSSTSTKAR